MPKLLLVTLFSIAALPLSAIGLHPGSWLADPPIWANAKHVKATYTECGRDRFLTFRGDAIKLPAAPDAPGCRSTEVFFAQVNVAKALFGARGGEFSAANLDAGRIFCTGASSVPNERGIIMLGTAGNIERAIREHPAPRGCTFTRERYQFVSSLGGIPFADVPNGGTMTIQESLALHAKERAAAIAECNASAACRAEVQRRSAINAYFDCMKPLQPYETARTCRRPW